MYTITMKKQQGPPYVKREQNKSVAIRCAELLTQFGDGGIILVEDSEGNRVVTYIRDPRSGLWQKGF